MQFAPQNMFSSSEPLNGNGVVVNGKAPGGAPRAAPGRLAVRKSVGFPTQESTSPTSKTSPKPTPPAATIAPSETPREPAATPSGNGLARSKTQTGGFGSKKQLRSSEVEPDAEFIEQALKIRKQLTERQAAERFIFRPGESKFLNYWDYIGAVMLLYTATFTPFEVAFLPSATPTNARFILSRILDVYFSSDLVAQFFISVRPASTEEVKEGHPPHDQDAWVDDHRTIARRYIFGGWFFFDVFTLAPSFLDMLPYMLPAPEQVSQTILSDTGAATTTTTTSGPLGNASILRTLRVLRFVKIFRVARVGRLLQRWAARVTLRHSTITVIKCLVYLLVAAHWYACIFALQASLHSSAQNTWLGEGYYAYCTVPNQGFDGASTLPSYCGADGLNWGTWYVASFAWSTMIITGTGGTDFYPSSKSVPETILVTCLVLIGAILWTQILALFCDVATNSDPGAVRFRQTVDEMNSYLEMHKLPKSLRLRVREYLHAQRDCQTRLETSRAVQALSPSLQVEVIMEVQKHFFERVPFLRRAEAPCVVQISLEMISGVFAPGELALLQHLYVIERGVVLYRGRVLTFGKVWGHEDVILDDDLLMYARTDRARAMSFMEYRGLSREALMRIVRMFPLTRKSLRRKAVYVALRRMMIDMYQDIKKQKGFTGGGLLLNQISKAAHDEEQKLQDRAAAIDSLQRQATSGLGDAGKTIENRIGELETKTSRSFVSMERKIDWLTEAVEKIASALEVGGGGKKKNRHRSDSRVVAPTAEVTIVTDRDTSPAGGRARSESSHRRRGPSGASSHQNRNAAAAASIGTDRAARQSFDL